VADLDPVAVLRAGGTMRYGIGRNLARAERDVSNERAEFHGLTGLRRLNQD
jgi:hypothetical protein